VATQPSVLGLDVDDALRPMAHYLRTTYTDDKSPVTVARLLASHPEVRTTTHNTIVAHVTTHGQCLQGTLLPLVYEMFCWRVVSQ
jgi:hypothetical protein